MDKGKSAVSGGLKQYPHIAALCFAIVIAFTALGGTVHYAKRLERRDAERFSDQQILLKISGSALARAAFAKKNMLPVLGASESLMLQSRFRSGHFFKPEPTGFGVFEIARAGETAINLAQYVAGLGESVRGKKLVISYNPEIFEVPTVKDKEYARSFSDLHANQMIFNSQLDIKIIRAAALRMWRYRQWIDSDPLLLFSLKSLVQRSRLARLEYYASVPLGRLQTAILSIQDHLLVLKDLYLFSKQRIPRVPRRTRTIDWEKMAAEGLKIQVPMVDNNPYGYDGDLWTRKLSDFFEVYPAHSFDSLYAESLAQSAEWGDLHILLETLKTYGAHPLFLGRPMKGRLYDAEGISADARNKFYKRLRSTIGAYGYPVVDFHEFEYDNYFGTDNYPHTSHEAWVYVDKAIDQFYHDTLPQ